jgi:RND superfamily putative drug exporter
MSDSIGVETSDVSGTGDSRKGHQLIEDRFEQLPSFESVVIRNPGLDVDDPAFRFTVESLVEELKGLDGVANVESYYDSGSPHLTSDDRRVVIARVELEKAEQAKLNDFGEGIMDALLEADASAAAYGFELGVLGGASLNVAQEEVVGEDFGKIMIITVMGGLIILTLAFGAVVAALIPIGIALVSIFTAVGVATIASQSKPLNVYFFEMIILMGLAVGIDYSLFIINRFREERAAGRDKIEAIQVSSDTTGRAVLYAGITVFVSLAGMLLTGDALFYGLGLGAMIVVVLAVVASLTLLPALISLLDHRLNWLRIPGLGRPSTGGGVWGRITDEVLAHPVVCAGVTLVALIALSIPLLSLNIGDTPITKVFDWDGAVEDGGKIGILAHGVGLMDEHFILGETLGLAVIVDPGTGGAVETPAIQASTANLIAAVQQNDQFGEPVETIVNIEGDLLGILVPLADVEDTSKANAAVEKLRELAPAAFAGAGVQVYVAGGAAGTFDAAANTKTKAPLVFGFVLIMAFLLLLVMFRSIAIPIKAIILNLLSVGAAMGVLVLVFQEGVGEGLLNFEAAGTIETFMPLFLFAVLFGLSMDYHMLLLNRVKEAYDGGRSNEQSVSLGIKATAVLITSAAIVMVLVFGAFATSRIMFFKQIGVGLGVAVLIDATIIRAILLPASMKLLGDWNWWLPRWLEWLPRISAEGERKVEAVAPAD